MGLLDTVVLPKLNGEYEAKINSYKEIENEKGGYIQVKLQLPDREFTYNMFPSSIDYVSRNLRNQFGIEDKVTLEELLELGMKQPFTVWISYNADYNSMNVAFHNNLEVLTEEAPEL